MKTEFPQLELHRFAGISLGGGKTERTALAVIEFYPKQKRIFLRTLKEKIKSEGAHSADAQLIDLLVNDVAPIDFIAFDVPTQLPKCLRCRLKCPGYEKCKLPEIKWMWEHYRRREKVKRPVKLFTPYTERCAEMWISTELEEPFHPSHALGANAAPLTARALFLRRRIRIPVLETYTKLSLWRIGRSLKVAKNLLRLNRHGEESDEARLTFLKSLVQNDIAFIYQQDMRILVENHNAFEALIAALTAYLKFQGQTERPPVGFPKGEAWIDYPKETIEWFP